MKENNSKIKNFKIFTTGVLVGSITFLSGNYHIKKEIEEERKRNFIGQFGTPKISNSVNLKQTEFENTYSFDYNGKEIKFQDKNLSVWEFDKNGKAHKTKLDKIEVEKPKEDIISKDYVTETEYNVYNSIQTKDSLGNEHEIYNLFSSMTALCEELLNRKDFPSKQERIDYIYNICINYISPDSMYTFGKYKYSDLNYFTKKDIKKEILKIKYIKDNGKIREEEFKEEFKDNFSKTLRYSLFY